MNVIEFILNRIVNKTNYLEKIANDNEWTCKCSYDRWSQLLKLQNEKKRQENQNERTMKKEKKKLARKQHIFANKKIYEKKRRMPLDEPNP